MQKNNSLDTAPSNSHSNINESIQSELRDVLVSLTAYASKEANDLIENLSQTMPKEAVKFIKRNWKPLALSIAVAATAGVSTYLLIQKLASKNGNKSSFFH